MLFGAVLVGLGLAALPAPAADSTAQAVEFFEKKIRPVLAERCYKCHSAASEKLKGSLRLDSRARMLQGGDTRPAIEPGHPERSLLIEAIGYRNPDLQMPPKGRLTEAQAADFTAWIEMGAPWPEEPEPEPASREKKFELEKRRQAHWAWQPIRPTAPPPVQDEAWPRQPTDRFLLAKLDASGLKPAPPADKPTLIRRLYFDLIGLPPTPREVEDFLNDHSAEAYDTIVDRLLGSPHFGERWARHWLDLVRYAETLGHEFDYSIENAWRYRDYVIRAFNADIPYNQFAIEHIAGDLLPQPRRHPTLGFNESLIGTGFYWLGQQTHSPVDVRLHQAETIDNQIDVLSKTFLGLTVACARCHDHKFDAISTKDFYSLYGIISSSRYAQSAIDPPQAIQSRVEQLNHSMDQIRSALAKGWSHQAQQIQSFLLAAQTVRDGDPEQTTPRRSVASVANESSLDPDQLARWVTALDAKELSEPEHPLHAWTELTQRREAASPGEFARQWQTLLSQTIPPIAAETQSPANLAVLGDFIDGTFEDWLVDGEAFGQKPGNWCDPFVRDGSPPSVNFLAEPAADSRLLAPRLQGGLRSPTFVISNRFLHVRAAGRDSRLSVVIDNFVLIRDPIYGTLRRGLNHDDLHWITIDLKMWLGHRAYLEGIDGSIPDPTGGAYKPDGWLALNTVLLSAHSKPPSLPAPSLTPRLATTNPGSLAELAGAYQRLAVETVETWRNAGAPTPPAAAPRLAFLAWLVHQDLLRIDRDLLPAQLLLHHQELASSVPEPTRVPGMIDGDGFDEVVFIRGNPKTPGEPVPRRFLEALSGPSPTPFKKGSGRLELAKQIIDPSNPFFSRVMVNRIWQHLFGRGVVPTSDDFGVLGQPPSHPELLDWLANYFRTEGAWSVKGMIRLLVRSSAYQMSSVANDPLAEAKDPTNTLLHRMRVRRLEGEAIRDAVLAVSDRLEEKLFGPSTRVHLTPFMEGRGRPGSSGPLDGGGRRSIYLEVRRNFLSPMMLAFDTPTPFTTIGKRTSSNVPAQALTMMNDPFIIQQAKLWAQNARRSADATPEQTIRNLYLEAFSRPPTEAELNQALGFLDSQRALYSETPGQDNVSEQIWIDLCHVLLNVKEFVFLN